MDGLVSVNMVANQVSQFNESDPLFQKLVVEIRSVTKWVDLPEAKADSF